MKNYIGIDQYGSLYSIKEHPRKELLEQLGRKRASIMYVDLISGGARKAGYVIGRYWISVYERGYQWNSQGRELHCLCW